MAFHDVRLPEDIERGATGGPRFKTTVMDLISGKEKRNIEWEEVRGRWDIGYGIQAKEELDGVKNFFYARWGRAHSFRFKDWSDFEIGNHALSEYQQIGTGTGTQDEFQIEKRYESGGFIFHRPTKAIVADTLRVFLNTVEQFSGWSVDLVTGIITFDTPPSNLVAVSVICEFDVIVRFDTDALDINMEVFNAGSFPGLPVVEVKDEE